ncbi:hypothetical protein APHAL10511_001241 [Amanita phalloides]|nr:hypothetical protein APHAL10511_001241 [Amanita phalloides]
MRALLRSARPLPRRFPRFPPVRFSSSLPIPESDQDDPHDDADKPKPRRTRLSPPPPKDTEPIDLPDDLHILWSSDHDLTSHPHHLPPPQLLEEALNNLHITLHPQTQHRATYSSPLGSPLEPTLGLYCPIEGGEYVIDATVRELALRTGSEVLVLDAVQLAASEWGHFGKAANALQLPRNPLHFSSTPSPPPSSRPLTVEDEEGSENNTQILSLPQPMTLTLMANSPIQGRAIVATPRRTAPPSRIKVFFDTLVNLPSKQDTSSFPSSSRMRPRLIYVRDFPTLAPLATSWYPHLLSAVRQRRRGPISRPSSPITNPMTIIFGMTPAIAPHASPFPQSQGSGLLNMILSKNPSLSHAQHPSRHSRSDWGEDDASERAREKRLRERLKKWEKGDGALHDEFGKLAVSSDTEDGSDTKPEIFVIGPANGPPALLPFLGPLLPSQTNRLPDSESKSFFFRTSMLVPQARSQSLEKSTRVARRREINELTMRMGVGAVGGCVQTERASDVLPEVNSDNMQSVSSDQEIGMWTSWGNSLEPWANVRKVADRALGNVMSSFVTQDKLDKDSLELTQIPWSVVQNAWLAHRSTRDLRKAWLKEIAPNTGGEEDEANQAQVETDEVIERLKNDSELDAHEQRLLPCIVDSASMTTSFNQVHLPPHTIDSVRTIVSLPLLHPQAFQQGILKEHGMTGCLLFGPPGTGKTLVVRALAKEAGCRMMMISPSDVMDMYVGEGEKLVKAVFSLARKLAPCVIFLDEIDALFGARMSTRESGGAFAHRGVITEFMQEMDGLKSSQEDRVIVIGATNRPFDLDDAVLRRLPRRLLVDLPGEREREEILKILLRDEKLADDVNIKSLAKKTDSFSGSDLKHLCVSAALDAVKEHVQVPWSVPPQASSSQQTLVSELSANIAPAPVDTSLADDSSNTESPSRISLRILHLHNFMKALKEITPSSSESLGSLGELRKWNEEFGEGHKDKKRQVWGKGRFGFVKAVGNNEAGSSHASINTTIIDEAY